MHSILSKAANTLTKANLRDHQEQLESMAQEARVNEDFQQQVLALQQHGYPFEYAVSIAQMLIAQQRAGSLS
jgi:hypothetical protein